MCRVLGRGGDWGGGVDFFRTANFLDGTVLYVELNSTYPDARYLDRFGPSGKFVRNFTQLTWLDITGYRNKYSTVLWLQIRRRRKV